MCKSENKICKCCANKLVKWDKCPEFDKYKSSSTNMDMDPSDYGWMQMHGAVTPTGMVHEFLIVTCTTCKNLRKDVAEKKIVFQTVIDVASSYAGQFMVRVQGSTSPPVKWIKLYHTEDGDMTDTETESEIENADQNNQLVLRRDSDEDETEEETETETEDA